MIFRKFPASCLTRNRCDADEGLAEQISLPFPSISRATLSYQRVTPNRPRLSQPIVPPTLHSPNTPIDQPGTSYQCSSSPSACSTASSTSIDTDGINWFSASATMGNLWSSPPAHAFGASGTTPDGLAQSLRARPQLLSPNATPTNIYTSQSNGAQPALTGDATAGLLPAWNAGSSAAVMAGGHHVHAQAHTGQGHGHDNYGTYTLSGPSDAGFISPEGYMVASGSAQQRGSPLNIQIPHQAYPHDSSPSIYSSLPATPTQPRHSQRFTSLPTIYTTTICEAAAISPLELSPRIDGEEWHITGPSSATSPLNHSSMHIAAWP